MVAKDTPLGVRRVCKPYLSCLLSDLGGLRNAEPTQNPHFTDERMKAG